MEVWIWRDGDTPEQTADFSRQPMLFSIVMRRLISLVFVLAALPLIAQTTQPAAVSRALKSFSKSSLAAHDRFLASDKTEGRGPGTPGDEMAEQYIAAQFKSYGLQPAGDQGTYFQRVPLLGLTTDRARTSLAFTHDGAPVIGPLKIEEEYVGQDKAQLASDTLDSDVVFVGHGVVAPEYQWDDYKGLDTRGKTLVMLVDDPPANAQEPDLFKGKTRTYYGR